jgi:hypothetical protein
VGDCKNFLTSNENWAERAAKLGWDAPALFGCRRNRPLDYLGDAGLLVVGHRFSPLVGAALFPAVDLDFVWPGGTFAGFEK